MTEMPSIGLQRKKFDLCYDQPITFDQEDVPIITIDQEDASIITLDQEGAPIIIDSMKLLNSPAKINTASGVLAGSSPDLQPPAAPSDMNTTSSPTRSQQGHPIDELTCEPVDNTSRSNLQPRLESNESNNSSDFGPFVSGVPDDFRPRSSSFNTCLLRGHGQRSKPSAMAHHPVLSVDPLRMFSETQAMVMTASADNVSSHMQHNPHVLHHSHTLAEIPPHALSNDSGYHTPPNRHPGGHNTSPPWPSNRHTQWPAHVSPPLPSSAAQSYFHVGAEPPANRSSAPLPLNQTLSIETGHYQPEPSTPQIVIGQPIYHNSQSMQPMYNTPPNYHRMGQVEPYGSLQSQGSTTPEEGICGYQRDRKQRLATSFQTLEAELARINVDREQLQCMLQNAQESNRGVDISATEREVQILESENQNLTADVQRLNQMIHTVPPPAIPGCTILPLIDATQPVPPATISSSTPPIPAPRVNSPSRQPTVVVQQPGPSTALLPYTHNNNQLPDTPPLAQGRVPPAVPPRARLPDEAEQWSCSKCTLLNHPLITSCEACETPRSTSGNAFTSAGIVKKSSCQHQSGCFCHAHLS